MLRRGLENCFYIFILTLATVICCCFFLVTNVIIVSRIGQNCLLIALNVNVNVDLYIAKWDAMVQLVLQNNVFKLNQSIKFYFL